MADVTQEHTEELMNDPRQQRSPQAMMTARWLLRSARCCLAQNPEALTPIQEIVS
jgi:hypothetical protein